MCQYSRTVPALDFINALPEALLLVVDELVELVLLGIVSVLLGLKQVLQIFPSSCVDKIAKISFSFSLFDSETLLTFTHKKIGILLFM